MTYSPSRKFHSNYLSRKQSYTQNRQQNINQTNLSQYSPSIRSPKLNQESQHTKLHNVGQLEELKTKLETVLKHNSHLLNQNATLSQMVNNLKVQLEIRMRREESDAVKMSVQYTTVIEELRESLKLKEAETIRLLDQVSRLHDECYRIELVKNNEIKMVTDAHEREMTVQVRNLKKAADDGKEILELQVKKLRESIELKNYQYEALRSLTKGQTDKLRSQLEQLRTQLRHSSQLKQLQLRELSEKHKQALTTTTKQSERETTLQISKLETKIRKLKQDVTNKNIEIEQSSKKTVMNLEDHQLEIQNLNTERMRLLEEIRELEVGGKENFLKEKEKMRYLSQLEMKNFQNIAQNERDCLKSQINKLLTVCASKTDQIKKLYNSIAQQKQTYLSQKRDNDKLIDALRKRIKKLEEDNLEQLELLKVKMAQLHQTDIKSLQQYYENQTAIMARQIKELQDQRDGDREKIHSYLQENDLLRKNFETELTKYKAKIQDYKVKFAAAHLEFREQITSIGTKMELTSQTLLRQTEQKQKGAEFFQAQKKKFHLLIQGKDKEIASAHETMAKMKEHHEEELLQIREQIKTLKDNLASKMSELKQMRKEYEEEFQRKSMKLIEERQESPNDVLVRENKELRDRLEKVEKELFQKIKQIEFTQRENKSLQQEVGLRAGFLQTMQLQSSAAIEDQRSKLKILMNENEVAMKDYYQTKLATKNKDIAGLQAQLHEKQNDIRQLIVKYNQLEKRLKELLDSQERLSEFEKKIVNLGMDQNLVKNMSEIFARNRK